MGFGLLFVGYLSLLFFKVLPPAMLAGAILMTAGLKKLTEYGASFRRAYVAGAALSAYFLIYTALWGMWLIGTAPFFDSKIFLLADELVYKLILLVFHLLTYAAIEDIGRSCGYEKGINKTRFCRALLVMYLFTWALSVCLPKAFPAGTLVIAQLIVELAFLVVTASLIYGCYMRITTGELLEEEEKKLRAYDEKYSFRTRKKH